MGRSFFVKFPKQRPVQGLFKKVQMYGTIEDKDALPFGLEQFGLESFDLEALDRLTAERLRAERLCTILKCPITVNI